MSSLYNIISNTKTPLSFRYLERCTFFLRYSIGENLKYLILLFIASITAYCLLLSVIIALQNCNISNILPSSPLFFYAFNKWMKCFRQHCLQSIRQGQSEKCSNFVVYYNSKWVFKSTKIYATCLEFC